MAFRDDLTIRGHIAAKILSAVNAINPPLPDLPSKAVIYQFGSREMTESDWCALMRSYGDPDDVGQPRVHGYGITRLSDDGDIEGNTFCRRTYTYFIRAFHWYFSGDDSNCSEMLFSREIDAITAAFDDRPNLDIEIRNGLPISWRFSPDPVSFGGEVLHLGNATLAIEPCRI